MEKIEIRPMTRDDVPQVEELEKATYGDHHWSAESFYNEMTNNLAHYYCLIGETSQIEGYAGVWHIIDEAHITNIAISKTSRRKKYGEALLTKIIEDCKKDGIKYLTLEVRVSNEAAISLYTKYGFKSLGVRKGYYQNNNEDALIMWTENIFWDKFKVQYEKNIEKLKEFITIK